MNEHTPEHVTDGTPCWCNPRVEHTSGSDVVIHRSWADILEQRDALLADCKALLEVFEGYEMLAALPIDIQEKARRDIAKAEQE